MHAWHRVGIQLTCEFQKVLRLIVQSHGRLKTNTSQVEYDLSKAWTFLTTKAKYNILKLMCPRKHPMRPDEMAVVTGRVICLV